MGKTVLMVEGKDDEHVVKHVCGARGLGNIDSIKEYGGKDQLLESISLRLKESDVASLGILMDADTNVLSRWDAIRYRLAEAGYQNVPKHPDAAGTVIEANPDNLLPRVGVWLMPDNKLTGILEDFLAFLVPNGDGLFNHVIASMHGIPGGLKRFDDLSAAKAKIHTWLAWQADPGRPLGQAISLRYLDAKLPTADDFSGWLSRTFFA
jgi:hypothetical protein